MKTHARAVVIGGGVVGCSVLYHLAKLGCTDAVLIERKELTAGSSWHAAGGFHAFNGDPGVARLQAYTIALYPEIQELSGQDVGLHVTGGLLVAETRDRWDFLRADWARQHVLGLRTELISPEEVRALCPIMDVSRIRGALYAVDEGHLDPYGTTHAYAKAARKLGAEVYRQTRVLGLEPAAFGWRVVTDRGVIDCEHVVNAAGLWAREVGAMARLHLPLVPMEHHYLITEDLPELQQLPRELPGILDLDGEIYLRQERKGMLLGVYERGATPWALAGTPWEYGENELLAPQLDRLTDSLDKGFQRFPALANAGIRRIVNGPFTFTPDGNPLVGPVPGARNYWAACGVMAGFSQGGGVGLALAQWIIDGEPEGDISAMDVARFGAYATKRYVQARGSEFYSHRFQIAYPNEHRPAGRPAKTSAIHTGLTSANAVFGVSYGLEIPLYFAPAGAPTAEMPYGVYDLCCTPTDPYTQPAENARSKPFTYLVTPEYKISPDLMVYARIASGYRAGGENAAGLGVPPSYQPDKTRDYEIGSKGDLFDHLFSFDVSVYYIDWNNIQLNLQNPSTGIEYAGNAGGAKSQGVELSLESRPMTGLKLGGWVAYNEAVLTKPLPPGAAGVAPYGVPGNSLPYAPRWSGNLSVDKEFPLADQVTAFAGALETYVGARLNEFTSSPVRTYLPPYSRTDLHAGLTYGPWTGRLYINNVTDRRGIISGGLGTGAPVPLEFYDITPRTIGVFLDRFCRHLVP